MTTPDSADDGQAKRSLSCLMQSHDACKNPVGRYVKPGMIPGSGGKPCACDCHAQEEELVQAVKAASFRPSNPVAWKRVDLDREIREGYVARVPADRAGLSHDA